MLIWVVTPRKLAGRYQRFRETVSIFKVENRQSVKMPMLVTWVVTPFGLAGRYLHFRDTYCLHRTLCVDRET